MAESPCRKEEKEFIEALLKHGEAEQRASGFLPLVAKPLDPTRDLVPVIVTSEMLEQWRKAKSQEAEAANELDAKADALVECRKAQ